MSASTEVNLSKIANANDDLLSPEQIETLIETTEIVFALLPNKKTKEPFSLIVKGEGRLQMIQRSGKAAECKVSAFWCPDFQRALALHQTLGDGRSVH